MVITDEQRNQMLDAAKPLMKWLSENCHPHCVVQLTSSTAELLEGIASHNSDEFLGG